MRVQAGPLVGLVCNNHQQSLQSLIVPGLHLSETCMRQLTSLISESETLKNLDISWNKFVPTQVTQMLLALQQNEDIQYLNIAFTKIPAQHDIKPLLVKIKKHKLLHLDCSGIFSHKQQVISLIRAIKVSRTLLVLHLSDTPAMRTYPTLETYIKTKLNSNKFHKPANTH